jgi:type IV secretory pathway TrbD component
MVSMATSTAFCFKTVSVMRGAQQMLKGEPKNLVVATGLTTAISIIALS